MTDEPYERPANYPPLTAEDIEAWEDMKKPSRRQKKQLTPYHWHCLAIQLRGLRAQRFAAEKEPKP